MILQTEPAFVGTAAALRLKIKLALGNGLTFGVVGHFRAVEFDDGVRAIESNDYGVPFWTGLARFC